MTPLEHAAAILLTLQDVAASPLPTPLLTSAVGAAVIPCPETRVALDAVTLTPNPLNAWSCDVGVSATYLVSITRDCARTFNEDGSEDYASLARVSGLVDADVTSLTRLFSAVALGGLPEVGEAAVGWGANRSGTISTLSSGELVTTTLQLLVGVP